MFTRMFSIKLPGRCFSAANFRRWHHTIFSLSSGHGKCGVSVIRVSGPQTLSVLASIASFPTTTAPKPRYAYLRTLRDPRTAEPIDRALTIWFPSPHSFTGEDSCEFQVHGGPAVVAAMLDTLGSLPGLRAARAGEFTKRAFYAGKLDLTAVEGLADLIHAETEQQRRQALRQAGGALRQLYDEWSERLLRCTAHLEAYIDFAEDQHLEGDTFAEVQRDVSVLREDLRNHLLDGRRGELMRTGVRAAIVGAPNVGKSSFMNHLCGKPISIVTAEAGTTRDVVETAFNVAGFPVVVADTAGLRAAAKDGAEREGIVRARRCAVEADLVLMVVDAERLQRSGFDVQQCLAEYAEELDIGVVAEGVRRVVLVNKVDLLPVERLEELRREHRDVVFVSCLEETGIEAAVEAIAGNLKELCGTTAANESPVISQQRHRNHVIECRDHLDEFGAYFTDNAGAPQDLAIAAQRLRSALRALGQITGEVSTEDVLDVIFKDFCIGK